MFKQLAPALRMTLLLTIVTGLIYPGMVTGLCQAVFPNQRTAAWFRKTARLWAQR